MKVAAWESSGIAGHPHLGAAYATVAFLAPPLALFVPKAMPLAMAAATVAVVGLLLKDGIRPPAPPRAILVSVGAVLAWAALSILWSDHRLSSLDGLMRVAAVSVMALLLAAGSRVLTASARRRIARAMLAGFILALVLLAVEVASGGWLRRTLTDLPERDFRPFLYNSGSALLAAFLWPALLAAGREMRRGRIAAAAILAPTVLLLMQTASLSALLGAVAGAVVLGAALLKPRATVVAAAACVAAAIVAAPLIARSLPQPKDLIERLGSGTTPIEMRFAGLRTAMNSIYPRLTIWHYVADRIAERPILGWGMNASRHFSNESEKRIQGGGWAILSEAIPLHPHNGVLQWWLELGLVGAILCGAVVLAIYDGIGRSTAPPFRHAVAVAHLSAVMAMVGVNYGIWQSWWLGGLALSGGLAAVLFDAGTTDERAG